MSQTGPPQSVIDLQIALHDEVAPPLRIAVRLLERRSSASSAEEGEQYVREALGAMTEAQEALGEIMRDRFASGLDLVLGDLAAPGGTVAQPAAVSVDVDSSYWTLDWDIDSNLYRIAAEAVRNAQQHAGATSIVVELRRVGPNVELRVADNGRGFDPVQPHTGLGLRTMRILAKRLGGILAIESSKHGTKVELVLPFWEK